MSVRLLGILSRSGKGDTDVAQKVSVTFACDYDSKEIPSGEHLSRSFSLDGRDYEIDLCERHSQAAHDSASQAQRRDPGMGKALRYGSERPGPDSDSGHRQVRGESLGASGIWAAGA